MDPPMRLVNEEKLPDGTRQLTPRVKEDCKKFSETAEEANLCETWIRAPVSFPTAVTMKG